MGYCQAASLSAFTLAQFTILSSNNESWEIKSPRFWWPL